MTCPEWSKWGALLCGSAVTSYGLWQTPVGGLYQPANAKRHPIPPLDRAEMGEVCGPNSPFSVKLFGLFDHFITPWKLELLTHLSDHRLSRDLWSVTALVVRKHLASLGMENLETRWSSSSKSISEVKDYSDWNYKGFFFPPFGNTGS